MGKNDAYPTMQQFLIWNAETVFNSVVSHAIHPCYKRKGVECGRSLLLVEHISIYLLISKTGFLCKNKYKEGGGKVLNLFL